MNDEKQLTEEEYLRVCGWKQSLGAWSREWGDAANWISPAEAVEAKLAEDRARLAFVLSRSAVSMRWPAPHLGASISQGHENVTVVVEPKR